MSAGGERRSDDLYPNAPHGTWPGLVEPYGEVFWQAACEAEAFCARLRWGLNNLTRETPTDRPALIAQRVKSIVERWDDCQREMLALLDVIGRIEAAAQEDAPSGS